MVKPVQPRERILALDVLRAIALFGIFEMNLWDMGNSWYHEQSSSQLWPAWYDGVALWVRATFFAGKFNSLFTLLFGIGFTIQLTRLGEGTGRGAALYLRRLAVLLAFGIVHAVGIWTGDVLHMYAILGLGLLWLRRSRDRTLLAIVVVLMLLPVASKAWDYWTYVPATAVEDRAFLQDMLATTLQGYAHGTYLEATAMRLREHYEFYADPPSYFWYSTLFLTMLIGMVVGRRRYIQNARVHVPLLKRVLVWGAVVGLIAAVTMTTINRVTDPFTPTPLWIVMTFAYELQRPALMLAYAAGIVLLTLSPVWGPRLARLQPIGRMALTNYLVQSVIGTFIFYGYGLGYYERLNPVVVMTLAVVIYCVQWMYSTWWLARWQFGPMEALWRALTYGAWPAMSVQAETPDDPSAPEPDAPPLRIDAGTTP